MATIESMKLYFLISQDLFLGSSMRRGNLYHIKWLIQLLPQLTQEWASWQVTFFLKWRIDAVDAHFEILRHVGRIIIFNSNFWEILTLFRLCVQITAIRNLHEWINLHSRAQWGPNYHLLCFDDWNSKHFHISPNLLLRLLLLLWLLRRIKDQQKEIGD